MIRFDILTLHPALCEGPADHSILGRAREAGLIELNIRDLRTWAPGRHRQSDDTPYGGGSGMVLKVDVGDATRQLVAGLNYKIRIAVDGGQSIYAVIYEELPCAGSNRSLTQVLHA